MHALSALSALASATEPLSDWAAHFVTQVSGDMPSFSMQPPVQTSTTLQPGSAKHVWYESQHLAAMQASHCGGKPISPAVASRPMHVVGPSAAASGNAVSAPASV